VIAARAPVLPEAVGEPSAREVAPAAAAAKPLTTEKARGGKRRADAAEEVDFEATETSPGGGVSGVDAGAGGEDDQKTSGSSSTLCKNKLEHRGGCPWCLQPMDHDGPHDPIPGGRGKREKAARKRLVAEEWC